MSSALAQAKRTIDRYRRDPVAFVVEQIRATPEAWQANALVDIAEHDRLAVKSGHGVGKSALMAWVIIWWHATRFPAKTACTAPTAHQLEDILWGELSAWYRRLSDPWRAQFDLTSGRFAVRGAPDESFAVARTARKENPEAFQGFHSPNMLFLIDEASGVEEIIFEVGQGAMSTAGAKTLMAGNPTRRSGYFFEAFHRDRARWRLHTVRCHDSTRVDPAYPKDMAERYGQDSDIYRVRVLGEFPSASSTQFIPGDIVEPCLTFKAEGMDKMPRVLAVDVARFGDDQSVLGVRQGRRLIVDSVKKFRQLDTMQLADRVVEASEQWDPDAIVIDDVGVGAGVTDRLRQLNFKVVAFNGGMKANDDKTYANRRAETWGLMRDALRAGFELPNDSELVADLIGPEYGFTAKQQIILERKEDMKKRGLASPDVADMLAMTFAVSPRRLARAEKAGSGLDPMSDRWGGPASGGDWMS